MAAGPKKAKRRGSAKTGRRAASTKSARSTTNARPFGRQKSQTRSDAPAKEASRKPARGRRAAAGLPAAGPIDPVLAAQLEAIAHGLEQITDIHVELEEMRTVLEELAQNVAALVANSAVQERADEPSEPAVVEEVVTVEGYDDTENGYGELAQPGFEQD